MMAGLRVEGLTKSFNGNRVIDDVSFEVEEGEFCVLLGPSGCGKTTVLRLIAGLETPDRGRIYIGDKEVTHLSPRERDVAMVFQSYALYPHMTVYENMAFPLRMRKVQREEMEKRVLEAARLLNIAELLGRKPRELSGGQRQRVAIGRAIVRNPSLFLFDEPLSNLDAKLRAAMRIELASLHRRLRATTLYVTHDQVEAMTLGQRIILLDEGRIQQIGTPEDVYERPSNIFVATFVGTPQMNLLKGRIGMRDGRPCFVRKDLLVDLPFGGLEGYEGKEVVLGIRPEALAEGEGPFSGRVEFIEHLGPERIIYISMDGETLVMRTGSGFSRSIGEGVRLKADPSGMHIFYEGRNLRA